MPSLIFDFQLMLSRSQERDVRLILEEGRKQPSRDVSIGQTIYPRKQRFDSIGAVAGKNNTYCLGQQVEIQPDGPVSDVIGVVGDTFRDGLAIASGYLP